MTGLRKHDLLYGRCLFPAALHGFPRDFSCSSIMEKFGSFQFFPMAPRSVQSRRTVLLGIFDLPLAWLTSVSTGILFSGSLLGLVRSYFCRREAFHFPASVVSCVLSFWKLHPDQFVSICYLVDPKIAEPAGSVSGCEK